MSLWTIYFSEHLTNRPTVAQWFEILKNGDKSFKNGESFYRFKIWLRHL